MASFNPQDANCLVVTGEGIYRYLKLIDGNSLRTTHQQLTKKDMSFSQNITAHTWTNDRLILYTDRGEVLLAETNGDFKMMMSESPVHDFSIRYAINSRPDGFVIADNAGCYIVYEQTNDPKNPFTKIKSMVSKEVLAVMGVYFSSTVETLTKNFPLALTYRERRSILGAVARNGRVAFLQNHRNGLDTREFDSCDEEPAAVEDTLHAREA
jgi:hypothetical protein